MAAELSGEDSLRLNVLLANPIQAVRIDESSMTLYALSEQGEAKVQLNPNCRDEHYLRWVRELLSSHFLGSPGGYPIYLRRWTRMGQARSNESLERLLLLGESEAVVAAVHAPGLTAELARRAWWAMPTAENARRMLERDSVKTAPIGQELAEYLVEYLPFEQDAIAQIQSVRLALQPGLIDEQKRRSLWTKAKAKNAYYVGFLQATPDDLPEPVPASPGLDVARAELMGLIEQENPYALQLCRVLDSPGQTFLQTAEAAMRRPPDQETVVGLLDAIGSYFASVRTGEAPSEEMEDIVAAGEVLCSASDRPTALGEVLEASPAFRVQVAAMLSLAWVGEPLVRPIFARSTAVGTVMRRKLEPITGPIKGLFAALRQP
jgi:hypothetical protein